MISTNWQEIRALRAVPTGLSAADRDRRNTFVASLRQAEELAKATEAAGYAAKPLPLFYCLSQAGRAIAAAHCKDDWHLQSHGLSVHTDPQTPILENSVKPAFRQNDSFQNVSNTLNSPLLGGVAQLGALWAANPDLNDIPIPATAGNWPKPFEIEIGPFEIPSAIATDQRDPEKLMYNPSGMHVITLPIAADTGADVVTALQSYPTLRQLRGIKYESTRRS